MVKIEITIIEIRRVGLTAKFVNHQLERLVEQRNNGVDVVIKLTKC